MVYPCPEAVRLLPGESADSDVLEDAEVWAGVYDELYGFLCRCTACPDVALEHFRHRRDHWSRRRGELGQLDSQRR